MPTATLVKNTLLEEAIRCSPLFGEFWECGVYQGGSAKILAEVIRGAVNRTLRLFDTFSGFPPAERGECKTEGEMYCPIEEVQEKFKDYRFISYHKGEVPFSFTSVAWKPIALAHIDLMLGKPTEGAIKRIWPHLVRGSSMIFEDWKNVKCPGVTRAIESNFLPWQIEETGPSQCRVIKR